MLFGGRENEQVIVCPRGAGVAAGQGDISVSVAWPEDPAAGSLAHCTFAPVPFHIDIDGFDWYGRVYECWVTEEGEFLEGPLRTAGLGPEFVAVDRMTPSSVKTMLAGQYRLRSISVWTAPSAAELGASAARGGGGAMMGGAGRADQMQRKLWYERRGEQVYEGDTEAPTFEARAGGVNEWKIEISQELLDKLREALTRNEAQSQPVPNSAGFGRGSRVVPRGGGDIDLGRGSGDGRESK
jgi:hypothetical protein